MRTDYASKASWERSECRYYKELKWVISMSHYLFKPGLLHKAAANFISWEINLMLEMLKYHKLWTLID